MCGKYDSVQQGLRGSANDTSIGASANNKHSSTTFSQLFGGPVRMATCMQLESCSRATGSHYANQRHRLDWPPHGQYLLNYFDRNNSTTTVATASS